MKFIRTFVLFLAVANLRGLAKAAESTNAKPARTQMNITIGAATFTATLEENPTATAFKAMLPMTVKMTELNGNEKYFRFGKNLPTNAAIPGKIENGDLMIYGADTLVLFYKAFSTVYSYTRVGRIRDPAGLAAAVGAGNVSVTYELSRKEL
ncbi:MAG TPA: cyclophilin-like fold protein [Verrucomicrobiae bacterium]|nr:cyclophilin-like fold protein [Verrucomicrobiae bacterium]